MAWKCQQPEVVRNGADHGSMMQIACGRCVGCDTKWRKGWVLRLMLEMQSSVHARFLTLTYETGAVPTSLPYGDVSSFLKRWRSNTGQPVRFFCSGEYGDRGGRPHWHLILFNRSLEEMPVGLCFPKEWPHGGVVVGTATPASMAYVAGYSLKKRLQDVKVVMSRRPGIGLEKVYELGSELARQVKEVDTFPGVVRIGRQLYPLHRRAKEVMQNSFLDNGGVIRRVSKSGLVMEAEAVLALRSGTWRNQIELVERSFNRDYLRTLEKINVSSQKSQR